MMFDKITINAHSSIRLAGEMTVYVDPFKIEAETHDADVICVTHSHFDHFSIEDIRKIANEDTVYVAPETMREEMEKVQLTNCVFMNPYDSIAVDSVKIDAVPSYNTNKPMHPKENGWLGYIVEIEDTRIYIAGDTDIIEEGKTYECDIAMVPCGGTYTMDASEAAEYVNMISPKVAIPTHYGSLTGSAESGLEFKEKVNKDIEVRILIHPEA